MRQTGVELLVDTVSEVPVPSDAQIASSCVPEFMLLC
jgi:hypothetical protein